MNRPHRPTREEEVEVDYLNEDLDNQSKKKRKNLVAESDYESDSEKDEEKYDKDELDLESRVRERGALPDNEDDYEDMFADESSRPKNHFKDFKAKRKSKKIKFMDATKIDGQEELHSSAEDESSDDPEIDDDEIDPEIGRGGLKKGAPKLDAFNLKDDLEQGAFDEDGTFHRDRDASQTPENDDWLTGISKKEMKKAKEAKQRKEHDEAAAAAAVDSKQEVNYEGHLSKIIQILEKGESVLEALQRLNKAVKSKSNSNNSDRSKTNVSSDKKAAIAIITDSSDVLVSAGMLDMHEDTREALIRKWQNITKQPWKDAATKDLRYEYKWTYADEIYGPYTLQELIDWNDEGYFNDGGILVREAATLTKFEPLSNLL